MTRSNSESSSSVRQWLAHLRDGSSEAAERLWSDYVARLSNLIRRRLQRYGIRRVDEEDIVVDVFASLCRGAERGRFPKLNDETDLWQVLVMLTNNKVIDQLRKPPLPNTESALGHESEVGPAPMQLIQGEEPSPEFAAEAADQLAYLMSRLSTSRLDEMGLRKLGGSRGDELSKMLQDLAARKLENMTNKEIAAETGLSLRVVERGLQLIRTIWER